MWLLSVSNRLFSLYSVIDDVPVATVSFGMINGFICGMEQVYDIGIGVLRRVCGDSQRNGDGDVLVVGYFMGCAPKRGEDSLAHHFSGA